MGTAARMTHVRAAAKNTFTEPPSTAPPPQLLPSLHPPNPSTSYDTIYVQIVVSLEPENKTLTLRYAT